MGIKFAKIPSTPGQDVSRSFLESLVGMDVELPLLEIAGLDEAQILGQEILLDMIKNNIDQFTKIQQMSLDQIQQMLSLDAEDTSQGKAAMRRANKAITDLTSFARRERNLGFSGSINATPAIRETAVGRAEIETGLLEELGRIDQRKLDIAGMGIGLPSALLADIERFGGAEREITQAENVARFAKEIGDIEFPFLMQSPAAQAILNEQRYLGYQKKKKSKSGLGMALGIGAALALGPVAGMTMAETAMLGGAFGGGIGSQF